MPTGQSNGAPVCSQVHRPQAWSWRSIGSDSRGSDYILHTRNARLFFTAIFDATFPYEKRMPGTDNDMVQTRNLGIPFDRITAPTLILHGTADGDVPFEHGENAARQNAE